MVTLSETDSKLKDKGFSKSLMLLILIHVVGDLHQPLHNAQLVSRDFPYGDKGGNLFKVDYKNRT